MGLLDLQDCELDDEMEAPAAAEREQRRATIEEVNDDEQEEFTRAGPTTRRAAVRAAKRNDRPPAPTPMEKILERTTGYKTTGSSKNAFAPDTHVLARCSANLGQWFGGTVVEAENLEDDTCRVVFLDGAKEDVSISNIRVWDRPPLSDWHRKHQGPIKSRYVSDQSKANTHRSVLQFDLETGNLIAQFVSARRAVDNVPSLSDPQEVLQCCKGAVESAGGYKWTFAAPRPKLDGADVQELIDGNYAIQIQQRNPKKAGTKSALLYDQYKGAESIRDMLALGARRADIPYDISHGWVTLVDPTLQKRFSPPPTAAPLETETTRRGGGDGDDGDGSNAAAADDDPMEEDDEEESKEDVLKTLPPRPPPARARLGRAGSGSVNYADPPDF